MADTGSERITDTFHFKHHAIPVAEITATNRIIDATTRLTTTIAGVQGAPPNKMEAIQSLCTLLLGQVALLPAPTPKFFLLLHHPPLWSKKMNPSSFGILNLLSLPCQPPTLTPTTSTLTATLLPSSRMRGTTTTLSPVNALDHLVTISFALCKTILSHAIN